MRLLENSLYYQELINLSKEDLPIDKLKNSKILITGARGLIGSFLIDFLMYLNDKNNFNCTIYAIAKSDKIKERFLEYSNKPLFHIIYQDINDEINLNIDIDYIVHLASNTHPFLYATSPISTITTNIIGTNNLLNYGIKHHIKRFLLASTVEVYGQNKGDIDFFNEDYCGYINSNTLRAGYPESKRCAESLCQAYASEKNIDVVIARFARCFGPTMLLNDSKAISQFIMKAINDEDIILKSEGNQYFSFTYVYDAVYGLLTVLLNGESKEAYNISNSKCNITLKDLATIIASYVNKKVLFELPTDIENKGFSNSIKAIMSNEKIKKIGYKERNNIQESTQKTINILKDVIKNDKK